MALIKLEGNCGGRGVWGLAQDLGTLIKLEGNCGGRGVWGLITKVVYVSGGLGWLLIS